MLWNAILLLDAVLLAICFYCLSFTIFASLDHTNTSHSSIPSLDEEDLFIMAL